MNGLCHVPVSHVNHGTDFSRKHLRRNTSRGRQFRHPRLLVESEPNDTTAYGGVALATALVRSLGLTSKLDQSLDLLKGHRPYTESDHVLTHVYNLFAGGTCIEDISNLQCSEAVRRMLGTSRVPDPTTAGDFLRRFSAQDLEHLDQVIDRAQAEVWRRCHGRKQKLALVDLDSHVKPIYGNQKEGADITYKGSFGYHPLAITLSGTQECLRLINRPGNVVSSDGASQALEQVFPLLLSRFQRVIVRGDSAFAKQPLYEVCEAHGQFFAFVSPAHTNFESIAETIPQKAWKPFRPSATSRKRKTTQRRKRRRNLRRKTVRTRGKRDLKLEKQWLAETEYRPARSARTYRLIIRRQRIEEANQGQLFELWRYRYVITNVPKSYSAEEAVGLTYQRCDQENIIEQLQNGVAAMRMPTGSFLANSAFLVIARLAHNLKSWLAQLALPQEVMRWEWKRFRYAFVYVAARVIHRARQTIVRIANTQRFAEAFRIGLVRLRI